MSFILDSNKILISAGAVEMVSITSTSFLLLLPSLCAMRVEAINDESSLLALLPISSILNIWSRKLVTFVQNVRIFSEFAVFCPFYILVLTSNDNLRSQYFINPLIKCILGWEKSDFDYMFVAKFGNYKDGFELGFVQHLIMSRSGRIISWTGM